MKTISLTDDRWEALANRDKARDGQFVYAVNTTGVYCRPSCAARTPKRSNVVVFETPIDAEGAGFRACLRCRPDKAMSATEAKVTRARELIDARIDHDLEAQLTLGELARHVDWSSSHLQRMFTRMMGISPRQYGDARRTERAKETLRAGASVLTATLDGGFSSGKALYERVDDAFGMTPGIFRRGGAGLRIRYALFDTSMGVVLVATTARGVCTVAIGDDGDALVKDLRDDFFAADVSREDSVVGPWAEPVLRFIAGAPGTSLSEVTRGLLSLPLEVRGTAFQRVVWSALRKIPVGQTRTYGEVAAMIGKPNGARAVAQACGANRIALVVPCHRVVGSGGDLRGYRWGPERKRELLEMESAGV